MQDGDFVEIEYTGTLKDTGEIFDLTSESLAKEKDIYNKDARYGPLKIIMGEGFVIKGLEDAIRQMKVGEEKKIELEAKDAFGERKADLIKVVSESELRRQKIMPYPGMILDMGEVKAKIQSVNSGRVRIDFNNPLAGRDVEYVVKVNKKLEGAPEKAAAISEFFCKDAPVKVEEKVAVIEEKTQLPEALKQRVAELMKKYVPVEKVEFKRVF
ncbi:MAG: peptidylprolyl isomerase [Candidatus Aenigmarchaeota archaeon]|nr:peptidylprolyl isomerase [Candidatus Aenigmarchaeota archaeon]